VSNYLLGVNFINVLRSPFLYALLFCTEVFSAAFLKLHFGFGKITKALSFEKRVRKMLMKLTAGG